MQSLDRAVAILDLLSNHEQGLSISEIASNLGLPLGTAHRFLTALLNNSLVVQEPNTKQYRLGWHILALASQMINSSRLISVAKQHMEQTATAVDSMVFLCQAHNREAVCTACVANPGSLRMKFYVQIGSVMPFHASASAKIIFAHHPPMTLNELMRKNAPLPRYTEHTRTEADAIRKNYEQCRQRGYAVCDEEMELGVQAVAAPVFGIDRHIVASIGIIGIKTDNASLDMLAEHALACAALISRDVGFTPEPASRLPHSQGRLTKDALTKSTGSHAD